MKSFIYLVIFLLFFSVAWGGAEFSVLVRFFSALFLGLLYVGGLEFLHQCVHNNAFSSRLWNKFFGRFFASLLFMNFDAYRAFHVDHHKYTCKAKDPERVLYSGGDASPVISFLIAPVAHFYFARAVNTYGAEKFSRKGQEWKVSEVCRVFILFLLLVLFVYKPFMVLLAHFLPLSIYAWVDYIFNQAEHYGCAVDSDAGVCRDPAKVSNDIVLPNFIGYLFLFRNYHRVHHSHPSTKWYDAPKVFARIHQGGEVRAMRFSYIAKRYLDAGVRRWGVR